MSCECMLQRLYLVCGIAQRILNLALRWFINDDVHPIISTGVRAEHISISASKSLFVCRFVLLNFSSVRLKASTQRRHALLCLSTVPFPPAVGVCSGFRWQHNSSGISANWQPLCSSSLELHWRKLSRHVWDSCPLSDLSKVTTSSP